MIGDIVSTVTKESVPRLASVRETRPPVEFVATIENVTFPFVSLDETVVVNVAVPPLGVLVNSRPSKVPVKLPRSLLSVTRLRVIILPAFAKLLPELLVILSDVIPIRGANYCYDSSQAISGVSCTICNCSIRIVVDRKPYVSIYVPFAG